MNNDNLEKLRGIYQNESLDKDTSNHEPIGQFVKWFDDALKSECIEPNGFVLSTISDNRPRSRVVLLKGVENNKFVFYTNYNSHKGHEIEAHDFVSMNFWWAPLARQVRVEGRIKKVDTTTSDNYFHKRPRGSQLGAIASPQSRVVTSRTELEEMFKITEEKFKNIELIPRPNNWGGYAIEPDYIEFWQGRANRLHDRLAYKLTSSGWQIERLAP